MNRETVDRYGPPLLAAAGLGIALAILGASGVEPLSEVYRAGLLGLVLLASAPIVVVGLASLAWALLLRPKGVGRAEPAGPDIGIDTPSTAPLAISDDGVEAAPSSKTCPQCAEEVKAAALVCRFCGHTFDASASGRDPSVNSGQRALSSTKGGRLVLVMGAVGLLTAGYLLVGRLPLADAEDSWCQANVELVALMADSLSLPPPSGHSSWDEWGLIVGSGLLKGMWDGFTTADDRPNRDRACRAAYQLR